MPNIEIKAKCSNLAEKRLIAEQKSTEYIGKLHQIDTYFFTKTGRLKLREINNESAELIPYIKDYSFGPMKSNYEVLPVSNPSNLKALLTAQLGTEFVVDKQREIFLIDNVRVHLDEVKDLGTFFEFEAVYEDEKDRKKEVQKVNELLEVFGIKEEDLLDKSYIDYMKK